MTFWMIYDHPSDYPTKWVLRAHDVPGGPRLKLETAATLEEIRERIPPFSPTSPTGVDSRDLRGVF